MSQRMFDQLDRLERGARIEVRPPREAYHDSSADFSAFEGSHADHAHQADYHGGDERAHAAFIDQPVTLDSFGAWHSLLHSLQLTPSR